MKNSSQWLCYFQNNLTSFRNIFWEKNPTITDDERRVIAKSIQTFQLGESSEGKHLIHFAKSYAWDIGDYDYYNCIRYFIGEEQRHARYLGRFMELVGIPAIKKTWIDSVFRSLRRLAGLEISISVLLVAETLALIYYPALRNATRSITLRSICEQIVRDEKEHVKFQAERLAILREKRIKPAVLFTHLLQRILFAGTCLLVWIKFRQTFSTGNLTLADYWTSCWKEMNELLVTMDPLSYISLPREVTAR